MSETAARCDVLDVNGGVVAQSLHKNVDEAWAQVFEEIDSVAEKAGEDGTEKRYEDLWDILGTIPAHRPGEAVLCDTEGRASLLFRVSEVR